VTITATGSNQVLWDGGGDGTTWNNAQNWAGDVPPQLGDRVVIDVAGTPTIVYSSGDTLILSLDCKESLTISGGTFEVSQASTISNLNLQNGILAT
jgi:hypothetical protein